MEGAPQRPITRFPGAGVGSRTGNPDELWGRPVYLQPLRDASMPFEDRVALAWEHIKATRFMPEEHERLRVALTAKIEEEMKNA